MRRNSLPDLSEYLFGQLDALSNDDLTPEQLELEVQRAKAMTSVGKTIIDSAKVVLEATKHVDFMGYSSEGVNSMNNLIGGSSEEK